MYNNITFGDIRQMADESNASIAEIIQFVALHDFPMTPTVIKIGILLDVLKPGYKYGWGNEL